MNVLSNDYKIENMCRTLVKIVEVALNNKAKTFTRSYYIHSLSVEITIHLVKKEAFGNILKIKMDEYEMLKEEPNYHEIVQNCLSQAMSHLPREDRLERLKMLREEW